VALGRFRRLEDQGHLLALGPDLDCVAVLQEIRADIDALAVDLDVAVIDKLPRRKHRRREFEPVHHGLEPALQQFDQVLAVVAAAPHRFVVEAAELAFADIAVITFELLLRHELRAEVRRLLAPLAMLAGTVFPLVERAFAAAPEIDAEAPIYLVLRFRTLAHSDPCRIAFY